MKPRLSGAGGACGAEILQTVRAKLARGEIVSAVRTQSMTDQICHPRSEKLTANRIVAAARRQFEGEAGGLWRRDFPRTEWKVDGRVWARFYEDQADHGQGNVR